ncbi:MAG: DUF1553 domain-containing protein, partial [Planctomycetes bacterium]|nr:DUF1553 domain-containing protein [Planctomycetota bacterium]
DHKYDPLRQREFYALFAFFNTTQDSDRQDERPVLQVFAPRDLQRRTALRRELGELDRTLAADTEELRAAAAAWHTEFPRSSTWQPVTPLRVRGRTLRIDRVDRPIAALRVAPPLDPEQVKLSSKPRAARPVMGRFVRISLPGTKRLLSLAEVQVFAGGDNLARHGTARQSSTDFGGTAERAIDGITDGRYDKGSTTHTETSEGPWWELDLGGMHEVERVVVWNRADRLEARLRGFRLELLDAQRHAVWNTTVERAPRPQVALAPSGAMPLRARAWSSAEATTWVLEEPLDGAAVLQLEMPRSKAAHRISVSDDPRFGAYRRVAGEVLAVLARSTTAGNHAERALVRRAFGGVAPRLAAVRHKREVLQRELDAIRPQTTVPVLLEQPVAARRSTHVHVRGNFLNHGARVEPAVPRVFPALPEGAPRDRLALARWLVDPRNPLTARVAANRFWELLFGTGLVATSEDFGIRGARPSHPKLLDYLASELVASGWDVKRLIRSIVTSSTYCASSAASDALRRHDPGNRLLARGPRRRLSAEMVRDQALMLAGLLSAKRFGPPVRPPRPVLGLKAAFGRSTDWTDSTGEDRHRRAIYTLWRRSIPYPSMATFDAPSREVCTVRREPTNTPLQALVTLNDPVYVEAAQALARRICAGGGANAEQRVAFGFELCTVRHPEPVEVRRLVQLFERAKAGYAGDPTAARRFATEPIGAAPPGIDLAELAAWTVVANVLLNLDEVLVKR